MTEPRRCANTIYRGPRRYQTCGRRSRYEVRSPYGTERERWPCGLHARAWLVDVLRPLDDAARIALSRRRIRESERKEIS